MACDASVDFECCEIDGMNSFSFNGFICCPKTKKYVEFCFQNLTLSSNI